MVKTNGLVSIDIKPETRARMAEQKIHPRESFNDVINKGMDLMAGTCGGHVQTAEEKAHDKKILDDYKKSKEAEK